MHEPADINHPPVPVPGGAFPPTRWSLVWKLSCGEETEAKEALADLCRIYWKPVYEFIRRSGRGVEDAEDLTQGFMLSLIARESWARADESRGRLRTFVLSSLQNYLHNNRRDECRQKRGGGQQPVSLDTAEGERLLHQQAGNDLTPEAAFDRQWGLCFLQDVLAGLAAEYESGGRGPLFAAIQPFLLDEAVAAGAYEPAAASLGLSTGAIKVAVHRLRGRYRERLIESVALTVKDESLIGSELNYLYSLFRG